MSIDDFGKYLDSERKCSKHTARAYLADLRAFEQFYTVEFEGHQIVSASYALIRNWLVSLVESGISARSINRKAAALKAYYSYCLRLGCISVNPMAVHKPLKYNRNVEIPFSESEMEQLLHAFPCAHTYEDFRDQMLIELLYATGIRRAELIGLQIEDVDLQGGLIKVLGKRNKERLLPLIPAVAARLQAYLEMRRESFPNLSSTSLFLTVTGNKIYDSLVYRVIKRYLREVSDKSKISPHVLRHTFATHLLNKGANINAVKDLLGHASLASTQVYTHNSIAELMRIHEKAHPRNLEIE
ncbi:MAG: hypothetical protein RLZZ241_2256 [Bacteroidota bacterium]|jgi:integrase/recombinase XerC